MCQSYANQLEMLTCVFIYSLYMWGRRVSEDNLGVGSPFLLVSLGDWTQVVSLGGKYLSTESYQGHSTNTFKARELSALSQDDLETIFWTWL